MPIYTYTCRKCGVQSDAIMGYGERDDPDPCPCGGRRKRRGFEPLAIGEPAYQFAAISGGHRIPGHFGKDAKRRKIKAKAKKS